jgi:hypothetical protein
MQKTSSNCAEVYEKTAEQLNIPEDTVRAVIYSMWNSLKLGMRHAKSHGFLIHNLGTFEVFHKTVNNEISTLIKKYRIYEKRNPGNITARKNFEKTFKELWKLRGLTAQVEKDFRLKSWYERKIHR